MVSKTVGRLAGTGTHIVRLVVYYGVLAAVGAALWAFLPHIYEFVVWPSVGDGSEVGILLDAPGSALGGLAPPSRGVLSTALPIIGSLAVMLPVAWVYMITKQREIYDRSVVHTIIMLPIAISGVVMIVQNSLALAFSLAGIVAAVRFRNTLKDTKDAVFIFVAIGVGLSAGVHALDVAAVVSVIFNVAILALWKFNFGHLYAAEPGQTRPRPPSPAQVLAGVSGGGEVHAFGVPPLQSAMAPEVLTAMGDRPQEKNKKKRRPNAVLLAHATDADAAQLVVNEILDVETKQWKLIQTAMATDGKSTLEYVIRTRKSVTPGVLLERLQIQGAPHVTAAEFRSLERLKF